MAVALPRWATALAWLVSLPVLQAGCRFGIKHRPMDEPGAAGQGGEAGEGGDASGGAEPGTGGGLATAGTAGSEASTGGAGGEGGEVGAGGEGTGGEGTGGEGTGGESVGGAAGSTASQGGIGTGGVGGAGGAEPGGGGAPLGGTGGAGGAETGGSGASPGGAGGDDGGAAGGPPTARCGDGLVAPGEDCDNGGESASCDVDCTASACGDGLVNATAGEDCDDAGETAACDGDCSAVACGDDRVNALADEECEPAIDADCTASCLYPHLHFLANRFTFDGTGTDLVDSVGSAGGTVVGTSLTGTGQLALSDGAYASLDDGLLSAHVNATVEVWATWNGGDRWQRILDFGSSDAGEDEQGAGRTYLLLMPLSDVGALRTAFSDSGTPSDVYIDASEPMPVGVRTHAAVVADDDHDTMSLYVDGVLAGEGLFDESLSALDDVNVWLGRSQFATDPPFDGSIAELRIYGAALDAERIAASYAAGPEL